MANYNEAVLLLKEETTFGTDASPDAASDALLVMEPLPNVATTLLERNNVRNDISQQNATAGRNVGTITFGYELRGGTGAGVAPAIGPALKCCGLSETVVAVTSVAYAPVSGTFDSCTIYCYFEGQVWKFVGCRGTYTMEAQAGQRATLQFTFTGRLLEVPSAATMPASPTYDTVVPPIVESVNLTAGGVAMAAQQFGFDQANGVQLRESVNAAEGFVGAIITSRTPTFSMNPEMELEGTHPFWGNMTGGTEFAVNTVLGTVAGNICTINAPKAQYTGINNAQRNLLRTYDATLRLNRSSGNDEYSFTFT